MSNEEWGELDQRIREVLAAEEVSEHPPDDELAAYGRDELSKAEMERLQEHLGRCRQCTATVLAVGFPRLEAPPLPDSELAADVESIMAGTLARPREHRRRAWFAVAVILACTCLALVFVMMQLQRQVVELEDALARVRTASTLPAADHDATGLPRTGVPLVDLYPPSVVRGEVTAAQSIPLPGDAAMVVLIITPPTGFAHDAYALRIFDATETELWQGTVRLNEGGAFVVVLPRRFVETEPDHIVLYGIDGTRERSLETYRIRFEQ